MHDCELIAFNSRTLRRLKALQKRDGLQCYICKDTLVDVTTISARPLAMPPKFPTIDHVIPRSRGGSRSSIHNQRIACLSCNLDKADAILIEGKKERAGAKVS